MKTLKEFKLIAFFISFILISLLGFYFITHDENKQNESTNVESTPIDISQVGSKKPNPAPPQIEQSQEMTALAAIMFKATKNKNFSIGPIDAKVHVIQFLDPENPTCAKVHQYIKNEITYYGSNVNWTFRYNPSQPNSKNAIKILEAARKQKLYLEVLENIYSNQEKWAAQTNDPAEAVEKEKELIKIVASVPKINISQIKRDMKNKSIDKLIEIDKKEGSALGVNTSPTLFVDYKIINPLSLDVMIQRIDSALNKN